mmetsp:Transcript_10670/g.20244  ORF Transcript_10670/g.20244 Transcript_10670/m.20244 type:complete len:93 (-) Transcript_10670:96-374(-)
MPIRQQLVGQRTVQPTLCSRAKFRSGLENSTFKLQLWTDRCAAAAARCAAAASATTTTTTTVTVCRHVATNSAQQCKDYIYMDLIEHMAFCE